MDPEGSPLLHLVAIPGSARAAAGRAERGRLAVQVSGPIGKLEIAGHREGLPIPLRTWIDPVGALSFELNESELLPVAADGGILLRVSGGDPDRPELTQTTENSILTAHYWR